MDRSFYGIVPSNSQADCFASPQGAFTISRLQQSDILKVLEANPTDSFCLQGLYDVSIKEVLNSLWQSVGQVMFSNVHLGGCALISKNLILVPCHVIEGLDVRKMSAIFGRVRVSETEELLGNFYPVLGIVECDPEIDYAILILDGKPGEEHGFLRLGMDVTTPTALLHYPLGKSQKLSVHAFDQTVYSNRYRDTYHDTDYGSSGGSYIAPSGALTAIHLGSQRIPHSFNLLRLALPIQTITNEKPNGILKKFLRSNIFQDDSYCKEDIISYCLQQYQRQFIDFEKYEKSQFIENVGYFVKNPKDTQPGVIIDSHQKKHTPEWPGPPQSGARGSTFPNSVGADDTIRIAEIITSDLDIFNTIHSENKAVYKIRWPIERKSLGNELFKKLKNFSQINIDAAFNSKSVCWEIHFHPS